MTRRRAEAHSIGREMRRDSIHQRLHALAKRYEQPVARATRALGWYGAAALPGQHGTYKAAVLLLHLDKLWHRRLHAQVLGIGRIDAPDHGLRHAFQGLAPETTRHELRQRFVFR